MANWFEDVTKTLADEKIGRRTAMRRVGGTVAGVALAGAIPGMALAKNKHCPGFGSCSNPNFTNCVGNANTNCFCFEKLGGKAVCACNSYCSQSSACSSSTKCKKGYVCIVSTGCNCSSSAGVCVAACKGKNKNCILGSGHGTTTAR